MNYGEVMTIRKCGTCLSLVNSGIMETCGISGIPVTKHSTCGKWSNGTESAEPQPVQQPVLPLPEKIAQMPDVELVTKEYNPAPAQPASIPVTNTEMYQDALAVRRIIDNNIVYVIHDSATLTFRECDEQDDIIESFNKWYEKTWKPKRKSKK